MGALAALVLSAQTAAQAVPFPVRIQGPPRVGERTVAVFSAVLPDRPVRVDAAGLSPTVAANSGGAIPVPWEPPVTLVWDFGDGTPPAEVKAYTSAAHVWDDDGDYTITLTVKDDRGTLARTTFDITVRNRSPTGSRTAAVEIDPGTRTVELTAWANDAHGDPLTYRWDFGDGSTDGGPDLWRVQHRYASAGQYEAVVVFDDGDGGTHADTAAVVVTGTAIVAMAGPGEPEPTPESVVSGFDATLSGAVSGTFEGAMRSFAGLHLSRISDGTCRFLFTAWDPTVLGYAMALIDLRGIPEGGARYTIDGGWLTLMLLEDARSYSFTQSQGALGMFNAQGLGGMVEALTGGIANLLPGADRARMVDTIGVDPTAAARNEPPRPMPDRSPFGLEDGESFQSASGTLELTFVPGSHATGTYDVTLDNTSSRPPPGLERVRMQGSFALDLQAARREGLVRYDGCGPAELEVTAHHPDDQEKHFYTLKPPVRVRFDRAVDPATLDPELVQVAYPAAESGEMTPVAVRMLRDPRTVWLIPEEDLQPGARYTVRVKTGADGVLGRDGAKMADVDGTGWWSFTFETMVDVVPEAASTQAAACNLVQTSRDAPLIQGKPAVARVAALWKPPVGIHPSAHVTDFDARVILYSSNGPEVASTVHRFVRPDLQGARGVKPARAEHTAQIYGFRPDSAAAPGYTIGIEVPTSEGDRSVRYRARCATSYWDYAPVITVDYVAFVTGEWEDKPAELQAMIPVFDELTTAAEAYARQLFPVAEIQGSAVRLVPLEGGQRPFPGCNQSCFGNAVEAELRAGSSADIVVGFVPHDLRPAAEQAVSWNGIGGGNTSARLPSGQGVVVVMAGRSQAYFPRYVNGLVHEWGHVLGLEHIPTVDAAERARTDAIRAGAAPILYRGIEGFRLTPAGDAGWNKSSVEGNEEGAWLAPLMYPGTIPAPEAFIANHHYRQIQGLFEQLTWSRNAGGG
jgi:PKD repeat protein